MAGKFLFNTIIKGHILTHEETPKSHFISFVWFSRRQQDSSPAQTQSSDPSQDPERGPSQDPEPESPDSSQDPEPYENPCEMAFHGSLQVFSWVPSIQQQTNLVHSINLVRVKNILNQELQHKSAIKWYLSVKVKMVKIDSDGQVSEEAEPYFTSRCYTLLQSDDLEEQLQEAIQKIMDDFENFIREGSGSVLEKVLKVFVNVGHYKPLKGKSFIPLPKGLTGRCHGIVNIQNHDNMCFVWSVLASLHPSDSHPERVSHYKQYVNELNLDGLKMPMRLEEISKFERHNKIGICVFGYEEGVYPLHISKYRYKPHVNLLLINQGSTQHYCLIKNLNKLLAYQTKHRRQTHFCPYCMQGFVREGLLQNHLLHCKHHSPQRVEMPSEDNKWLRFTDFAYQLKAGFVIYCDLESLLPKVDSCDRDPDRSSTTIVERHVPCGFCYRVVSTNEKYSKPAVLYRGPDAVGKLLKALQKEECDILKKLKHVEPMKLRPEDEVSFKNATLCHICQKPLGADRVRDHDHLKQGFNYRGAAHNACNLNYKQPSYIPVIFQNLKNYLLMSGISEFQPRRISCIPNNMEKYISFSIGSLRFIDSLQFLNSSLDKLVANLAKEGVNKFPSLSQHFPDSTQLELLMRKGVYCYSFMDQFKKFDLPSLPSRDDFFNILTGEAVSDEDYAHAQLVWNTFQMKTMGEYHDLYLKTDVLLLESVFKNFRTICLEHYGLDPAHFYTSPGLSWKAMLKKTQVELELLTDIDKHLFIEEGIRGGVAMISTKHGQANNPYIEGYDKTRPNQYIVLLDSNNLYGKSMSMPLPDRNFQFLSDEEIEKLDILNVSDDGDTGYICEVDLEYPFEIHDLHNEYPLAPQRMVITPEMISPYNQMLIENLGVKPGKISKLVPNLNDKTKYIVHYRNLKQYVELGMKINKIHRILSFHQSTWLKPYIDFNTYHRKRATNEFEKDFFKLMNNSVFGKTMENLRNHSKVELVCKEERIRKVMAKPSVTSFKIFGENFAAVNMIKTSLVLNRPIYVGMSILDISKTIMYDFHYNYIKKKYGENSKLLLTDTDSLCYQIQTSDIYLDMQNDLHLFDTSNYPQDHFLFSNMNKKVLGKFKDELAGSPALETIGLKAKMYSIDLGTSQKKVAKCVNKSVIKRVLDHSHYKQVLFEQKSMLHQMYRIQSHKHQVSTLKINKLSLSPFDDKRYFLNETESYAHGHFKINQIHNL